MAFGNRGAALYRSTPNVVAKGYTPGQWIQTDKYKKKSRFVGYLADGTAYLLHPAGKNKSVSMAAFRLARLKPLSAVLATVEVTGRIVDQTVSPGTSSADIAVDSVGS